MRTATNSNERMRRLDEASQWLLRMQDPKRTDEEMNAWLRWIDSDAENFAEFERLQRDWIDLDALKGDELIPKPGQKSARFVARRRIPALAAGIATVTVAAAVFLSVRTPPSLPRPELAAATTNRAATLPDGSRMILAVQSRVNMDFNGSKRQLDLSNGEAYFKVQHDTSRPFVVRAGDLSVTAIGTAFDVRRERDGVTVTVEEGTVEVSSHASDSRSVSWRAQAGYQLTYSTRDHTASLASVNPDAELAWRRGELAYVREPLGTVVENLNHYSVRSIVIEDPEIAALSFTGTVFASSLDDWLAGIEQAYPITVRRTGNGDIILSPRK